MCVRASAFVWTVGRCCIPARDLRPQVHVHFKCRVPRAFQWILRMHCTLLARRCELLHICNWKHENVFYSFIHLSFPLSHLSLPSPNFPLSPSPSSPSPHLRSLPLPIFFSHPSLPSSLPPSLSIPCPWCTYREASRPRQPVRRRVSQARRRCQVAPDYVNSPSVLRLYPTTLAIALITESS